MPTIAASMNRSLTMSRARQPSENSYHNKRNAYARNLGVTVENQLKNWESVQATKELMAASMGRATARLIDGMTHIEPTTGTCNLNPAHLYSAPALCNHDLTKAYYSNITNDAEHSQTGLPMAVTRNKDEVLTGLKQLNSKDASYVSSFALVPNVLCKDKSEFELQGNFMTMVHEDKDLGAYGSMNYPILGTFITAPEGNDIRNQYKEHGFYRRFVSDAVVVLSDLASEERAGLKQKDDMLGQEGNSQYTQLKKTTSGPTKCRSQEARTQRGATRATRKSRCTRWRCPYRTNLNPCSTTV
jgi:hypothetical protein